MSGGPPTTREARYKGFNERHVVPAKSSQRVVERHDRLDGAFGHAGEPQRVFAICRCGTGTLNDTFVTLRIFARVRPSRCPATDATNVSSRDLLAFSPISIRRRRVASGRRYCCFAWNDTEKFFGKLGFECCHAFMNYIDLRSYREYILMTAPIWLVKCKK
jgi:hypothetical protein